MAEQILLQGKVKAGGRIKSMQVCHSGKEVWRKCTLEFYDGGHDEKGGLSQKDILELDRMDVNNENLIITLSVSQRPLGISEKADPSQRELTEKSKGGGAGKDKKK